MALFQILALDPAKKTRCEGAPGLLYAIRSFTRLWQHPRISEPDLRIVDDHHALEVREQADPAIVTGDGVKPATRAFAISLDGEQYAIGPLRLPLVEFIKEQNFEHRYIVRDEISENIACHLYPYLYKIENLLRGYLTQFMATRFGGTWWKLNASKEMDDKAKMRKKNELVFGKFVDNGAFLIDFSKRSGNESPVHQVMHNKTKSNGWVCQRQARRPGDRLLRLLPDLRCEKVTQALQERLRPHSRARRADRGSSHRPFSPLRVAV